jgi:glucose-6-phosphate isomerase
MSGFARCDRTTAWAALRVHHEVEGRALDLREAFAREGDRAPRFTLAAPHLRADLSKNRWSETTRSLLLQLATDCGVLAQRDAMLAGEPINGTEGRAVLHTALRAPRGAVSPFNAEVHQALDAMLGFAEQVRAGGFTDVVHIGIGGSDLGPAMVVQALQPFAKPGLRLHFVSNVDGHDLAAVLPQLDAGKTLFIVASKTFTTQETLANANAAKAWFLANGGSDVAKHFAATSSNVAAAGSFGIAAERVFGFWDWVGGRYSLWSVIGLPVAIAIGADNFRALLAGAHAMDRHFADADPQHNLPLQLGLLDVWYRNFHGFTSRSVAPYHQGLRRLPAYLQQLEMESNGKSVDRDGESLPYATSPVVWGEAGTNGQHAYFQMLHQGTDVVPVEFIAVREPVYGFVPEGELAAGLADQQQKLLANCLAQAQALMQGKRASEALGERAPTANPDLPPEALARHRSFPGNRPSTLLMLERLDPQSLGALIALYEHRVFVSGAIWGINSFDQWGVELGKALCSQLLPRLSSGDVDGLDGSTAAALRWVRGDA